MVASSEQLSRSFADPISSVLNLSAFELARGLGDIMLQRYPYFALPQLLHELTHQWSFNTAVGHAIVSLLFRAQRQAALTVNPEQAALDYARADLIQQIMLPLAEGLALIAEHDLVPGPHESTARPLLAVAPLVVYGLGKDPPAGALFPHLARKLGAARLRSAHLDRKSSLLIEPISSAVSPHAIGYLATKSLQMQAAQRDERLLDADLFLQVAHGYFYDDWELVALLLDDDACFDTLSNRLLSYFSSRLARFPDTVNPRAVDEFMQRLINVTGTRQLFEVEVCGLSHGFWVDSFGAPPLELGRVRLTNLMQDSLDTSDINDDCLGTLISLQLFMSAAANVVTLAAADMFGRKRPGRISLTQSEESLLGIHLPMDCKLEDGWEGWLRVIVVLVVELGLPSILVFKGEEIIGDLFLSHNQQKYPDNGMLKMLALRFIDPQRRQLAAAVLRDLLSPHEQELDAHRANVTASLDDVYGHILYSTGSGVCIVDELAKVTDRSLLSAFQGDITLVEAAARISLSISGVPYSRSEVVTLASHIGRINKLLKPLFGVAPISHLYESGPVVSLF